VTRIETPLQPRRKGLNGGTEPWDTRVLVEFIVLHCILDARIADDHYAGFEASAGARWPIYRYPHHEIIHRSGNALTYNDEGWIQDDNGFMGSHP